ncbi:DUF6779 domain-containing protein [Amycolatopsis sp. NPDC059021]|uniref:DUF6779 domain-containing protein n=1 Tax=Amycolatopsis sp. NPDC059021 TaxID=3346704 RepID=UPI0036725133
MTGVGDDSRGRLLGRPWLVVGLVLAIGATLALVLSDDLRYLRLGIVAALWAALIGGFLAVRYRKHAAHSEDAVAEAQAVYELELEREIAARREYELEMEAEARAAADSRSQEELEALRSEVLALRESLQALFGGEVLLERVALTAQATRMRSLHDENRLVTGGDGTGKPAPAQLLAGTGGNGNLSATLDGNANGSANGNGNGNRNGAGKGRGKKAKKATETERPTELIDRVKVPMAERRRKPAAGNNGDDILHTQQISRPKPAPAEGKPPTRPAPPDPLADTAAARAVKDAELRAEAARRQAAAAGRTDTTRIERQRPPEPQKSRPAPARAEATRRDVPRSEASQPAADVVRPAEVSQPGMRAVEASRPQLRPAEASRPQMPRAGAPQGRFGPRPNAEQSNPGMPAVEKRPAEPDLTRPAMKPSDRGRPASSVAPPARPRTEPETPKENTAEWQPGWAASRTPDRAVSDLSAAFPSRDDFAERARPNRPQPPVEPATEPTPEQPRAARQPSRTDLPPARPEPQAPAEPEQRKPSKLEQFSRSDLSPILETPASRHGAHRTPAEDPPEEPTTPTPAPLSSTPAPPPSERGLGRTGGRRRRADDDQPAPSAAPASGGGRRRRPEGEPPAWEGLVAERASTSRRGMQPVNGERNGSAVNGSGSHQAEHDAEANGSASRGRRSAEREEAAAGGSHAAGRSVNELLAAHGAGGSTPRRRRRAED